MATGKKLSCGVREICIVSLHNVLRFAVAYSTKTNSDSLLFVWMSAVMACKNIIMY